MTEEEKTKDSPDKDKGLELIDDKPPDMGQGDELITGKEDEVIEEEKIDPETEALMKKKGFKDPAELARAYEAQEKKQTELEKDARLRSFIPSEIPARPKVERTFTEVPELTKDPYDMSKEEFKNYQDKREKRFEEEMTAKYEDAEADKDWDRGHQEVMRVMNKNPERFEAIKPQMRTVYQKHPNAPIEEIYSMADELEKGQRKSKKDEFLRDTFGPDADIDKLKTIISKARPAVVSDATGAGAETVNKTSTEKAGEVVWNSIKNSNVKRDS